MDNRLSVAIVSATTVLVMTTGGCHLIPPPVTVAPPPTSITIGANCEMSTPPELMPGDRVTFCYTGECEHVSIVFESSELFGRDSVRIGKGGCTTLRVMSEAAGKTYDLDVDCACDMGGGHTTPEIKIGGGGP